MPGQRLLFCYFFSSGYAAWAKPSLGIPCEVFKKLRGVSPLDSLDCIEENQRGYIGDSEKQVLKYLFLNNELFCIHIEESPQQIVCFLSQ